MRALLDFGATNEECPLRSFFWSVFSRIRTEYGDLQSKF